MDYNYFKLHQTVSWKVNGNFYVGAGLHLDSYSKIVDKTLDTANSLFTHHYNYSTKYGFNSTDYTVNGVSLNLLYDSRDNQVNANHGWYGNINFRVNPALSKHQRPSTVLYAEYRKFWPLSKTNEQHVFAIWAYGQFATSGKLPYLNLPALGWDQRSRAGKGYQQGLFRGNNLMYFEAEYRFPITCNQLISGTVLATLQLPAIKIATFTCSNLFSLQLAYRFVYSSIKQPAPILYSTRHGVENQKVLFKRCRIILIFWTPAMATHGIVPCVALWCS